MEILMAAARYYQSLKARRKDNAVRQLVRAELDLELFLLKLRADLKILNSHLDELAKSMDLTDEAPHKEAE